MDFDYVWIWELHQNIVRKIKYSFTLVQLTPVNIYEGK